MENEIDQAMMRVKTMLAMSLRVAYAAAGELVSYPERRACDEAERMMAEIKNRGWDIIE